MPDRPNLFVVVLDTTRADHLPAHRTNLAPRPARDIVDELGRRGNGAPRTSRPGRSVAAPEPPTDGYSAQEQTEIESRLDQLGYL